MTKLQISSGRLISTIHETANKFGATGAWGKAANETGVCRLALSDLDKEVRDWLIGETTALGCEVKVDEVGNIFSVFPGQKHGAPTGIGSHLDTQPTGGRYDGILGVLAGLEVLRTMKQNNYVPQYPIALVDWTNEEGARFPMSIMALSVWAENQTLEYVYGLKSVFEDVTVEQELVRIGYKGATAALYRANPLKAHFELHIEQGPILEAEQKQIGVVVGVQAYVWFKVRVYGKAQHTGTTPLAARSDALLAASRMIVAGNELAENHGGLFSVGVLNLKPAVVNVIPEYVEFTVDIRHVKDVKMEEIEAEVKAKFDKIVSNGGKRLAVEFEHIYTSKAVQFHDDCIGCVRAAAKTVGASARDIVSGAGHDSCSTSTRVPTSMIFIPSKDGVSHNFEEYSTPEEVERGFEVLLNAVMKYDEERQD